MRIEHKIKVDINQNYVLEMDELVHSFFNNLYAVYPDIIEDIDRINLGYDFTMFVHSKGTDFAQNTENEYLVQSLWEKYLGMEQNQKFKHAYAWSN